MEATIVVVTSAHSWGRSKKSLAEALKFAKDNASTREFRFVAYVIPDMYVTDIEISEVDGGLGWVWTDLAMEFDEPQRQQLRESFRIAAFMHRKNGTVKYLEDE